MDTEHVTPQDAGLRNSAKADTRSEEAFLAAEQAVCYWNDKKYSDGSTVCDNHRRYECWNGKWAEIGDC